MTPSLFVRVLGAGLALSLMSACGYRGGLERPAPILWEDRTEYEAEQKAKQDAEKAKAEEQAKAEAAKPQA